MRAGEGEQQPCPSGPVTEGKQFLLQQPVPRTLESPPASNKTAGRRAVWQRGCRREVPEFRAQELWSQSGTHPGVLILGWEAQHIWTWGSSEVRENQQAPGWLPVSTRVLCRVQMGERCYPEKRVPGGRQRTWAQEESLIPKATDPEEGESVSPKNGT